MTILVIGGTGRTGLPLSKKLVDAGHSVLVSSRSGSVPAPLTGVKFDWDDPSTFQNPFNADSNIDKVYLISPVALDRLTPMKPFIDLAVSKGVKRFVFLSASSVPLGGPVHGKVHEYLAGIAGIELVVLRPTWFFENLSTAWVPAIRERGEIITAAQDGKIPFIGSDDIADVAFNALTIAKVEQPDLVIIGPDLLTYDQVAEILSTALGRKITHRKVTVEEVTEIRAKFGIPLEFAKLLATLDNYVAQGTEEKLLAVENKYVGKERLVDWVEKNKAVWHKA